MNIIFKLARERMAPELYKGIHQCVFTANSFGEVKTYFIIFETARKKFLAPDNTKRASGITFFKTGIKKLWTREQAEEDGY